MVTHEFLECIAAIATSFDKAIELSPDAEWRERMRNMQNTLDALVMKNMGAVRKQAQNTLDIRG